MYIYMICAFSLIMVRSHRLKHMRAFGRRAGYGLPLPPTGKTPTTPLQQNHDGGAIRIGPNTLPETAMT
jgi:hypothetical protein